MMPQHQKQMPNVGQVSEVFLYNEKTKLSANGVPDSLHLHSAVTVIC